MKITILAADRPLTKSYKKNPDGSIDSSAYPNAYEFTSREVSVSSLQQLAIALDKAAQAGECLLKGLVQRPLVSESRAGSTNALEPTALCIFDTDGADFPTTDSFMDALGLGDVSYVAQYSASSGFKPGLRAHIYTFLSTPVAPSVLRNYTLWKNLTISKLLEGLNLTRTGMALRYPLDITANQNDKLIYLAPPQLDNLADPHQTTRIQVFNKTEANWSVPATPSPETLRHMVQVKIGELRDKAGLPKKKPSTMKMAPGGVEYLPNPGEAAVTGVRMERGFVYLNLNGGDSWGYYYPENNPEYLYNFKGEPTYKLSELCPAYWSALQSKANTGEFNSMGMVYLGICDKKNGSYWKVTYDNNTDTLTVNPARSKDQIKDFLKQHGQPVKDVVFDWSLEWNPKSDIRIDLTNKIVNTFEASEYMKKKPLVVSHCPPTIKRVMLHMLGDDTTCFDYVVNWIAFILQRRERTNVALVEFGTQGTGKGVFFHRVLSPIFGRHNVVAKRMEELEGEFTGFMDGKFFVFIDEVQVSRSAWHQKVTAKLKNLIAEPWISVRKMYMEAYMAPNYANFIFASNSRDPIEISPDDRRFTVAPFQPNPIKLDQTDFDKIDAELFEFYSYLSSYQVDEVKARTPYANQERKDLIETSMLSVDVVSRALKAGDIDFFIDQLPQNIPDPATQRLAMSDRDYKLAEYKALMKDILTTGRRLLSRDDLYTLYAYCVDDVPKSPNKFTSFLRHHDIRMSVVWINQKSVRGINVTWVMNPTSIQQAMSLL